MNDSTIVVAGATGNLGMGSGCVNELLVGFLGFRTCRFDTPLRRSYTSPRHECPSWEDYYVETFAGCFPDCCLRNYRLCARTWKVHQPKLTPQNSGTTQLLIAVSPVNSRVVWAAGTGGTYVVTTDGGETWKAGVVPGAESLQFRDVHGVSDKVAYLMSIGNNTTDFRIYKTVDGGATWTIQFKNETVNAFYDCFAFWTPNRGITHSDSVNGVFPDIRTTDGMTWQSMPTICRPRCRGKPRLRQAEPASQPREKEMPGLLPAAQQRKDSGHQRWRRHLERL